MLAFLSSIMLLYSGEGGGSLLDVNPGLIFWTVITFVLLLLILKKMAWKPILSSLDERENFIKESKWLVRGLDILDLGASTGGFTDCLLQMGAKSSTCVDVGRGQ